MDPDDPSLYTADEQHDVAVDLAHFGRLARYVLEQERVDPLVEMSLIFVDETTIAQYNERFLGQDGPTDVLAFPIDEEARPSGRHPDNGGRGPGAPNDDDEIPTLLGDVLVCPAYAQREAVSRGIAVDDELSLLVVHGTLHLLGFDHAEDGERAAMQAREATLLAGFAATVVGHVEAVESS